MFPAHRNPAGSGFPRSARRLIAVTLAAAFASFSAFAQTVSPGPPAVQPARSGDRLERAGNRNLRVGGVPFFVHAAQFDYFRIPPDLWARSLLRYRDLGINTIDIRIPWNWHEPQDGKFDFDGHTNPNRDLTLSAGSDCAHELQADRPAGSRDWRSLAQRRDPFLASGVFGIRDERRGHPGRRRAAECAACRSRLERGRAPLACERNPHDLRASLADRRGQNACAIQREQCDCDRRSQRRGDRDKCETNPRPAAVCGAG